VPKKPYMPPAVQSLGSIATLTQGSGALTDQLDIGSN
jgi:hypothetical protein